MTEIKMQQMAAAKRTAMNVHPLVKKKNAKLAQIAALQAEVEDIQKQIDVQQSYVMSYAGGLTTEKLLVRDEEKKVYKENLDVVYFDEKKRVWVVKEADDAEAAEQTLAEKAEAFRPEDEDAERAAKIAEEERLAAIEAEENAKEETVNEAKPATPAEEPDPFAPEA